MFILVKLCILLNCCSTDGQISLSTIFCAVENAIMSTFGRDMCMCYVHVHVIFSVNWVLMK